MEKRAEITVVIGTLNRPHVVATLLTQLLVAAKTIQLEVIVVDQSTPENWQQLQREFPQLPNFTLIHFDTPNTCKYLNYGWQHAKAPIVLYLDDDVELTDGTLQAHINAYTNPAIQAVAGRVINDGEQTTTDSRVGQILWNGAVITKNFSYEKETYVAFPYGCNMSFRKDVLKEIGGFDERLSPPIYAYNEVDLGYRISKGRENSILFVPQALVYHHQHKRGGTRNDFDMKAVIKSNNYNYGYFIGKNFSPLENMIWLLRRLPYQILKDPGAIPAIISGYLSSQTTKGVSNKMK
jgi:GT2 family glycosyltransferase